MVILRRRKTGRQGGGLSAESKAVFLFDFCHLKPKFYLTIRFELHGNQSAVILILILTQRASQATCQKSNIRIYVCHFTRDRSM